MDRLLQQRVTRSRIPARLDLAQSLTGLALAIFLWTHLVLVSSILLGEGAMDFVAGMMELKFLSSSGHGYPIVVSGIAAVVFALFIAHAGLAMRKFPSNWEQATVFRSHMKMMHHKDTSHWWRQVATGFIMFFLGSVHIYVMLTHPAEIGAQASSARVVSWMWPLYLLLLFAGETHAAIGMYRLAVKWGVLDGRDPRATRRRLQVAKSVLTAFFLLLGLTTLGAYVKVGLEHRAETPAAHTSQLLEDHSR